jgi:hypothetical protein
LESGSRRDKLVKGRRAATKDENAALPHWNVEPSAEPVDGAALLNSLRQVFRRYVILPKGADIALPRPYIKPTYPKSGYWEHH